MSVPDVPIRTRDGQQVLETRDIVRDAILSGQIGPGIALSQPQIIELLKVGRTPLREALRILQGEGLVIIEPNRRVRIAALTGVDLEQLYIERIPLEALAARITIPLLDADEIAELQGMLAQMDHFASQHDFERSERPHRKFHALLVSRAGHRVTKLLAELNDQASRYRREYLARTNGRYEIQSREHRAIFQAANEGDAPRTADLLIAHYERTFRGTIAQIQPGYDASKFELAVARATAPG